MSNAAADVESIFNLVECATRASEDRRSTEFCLQSTGDRGVGVGLAGARGYTGGGEPLLDVN